MRILDSEHAKILKENEKKEKKQVQAKVVKKAPKWQKQSEEFRAAIKNTGDGPSVPVKLNYDDYTHCQYCNKKYNQQAYDKHLNFCMKKAKESSLKPKLTSNSNLKPNLNMKFKK